MIETNDSSEFSVLQLGNNLKTCREARGRTLQDVSHLLGIPTSRLKKYEAGQFTPSLPEAEALSYIYHVPLFALLEESQLHEFIHDPHKVGLGQLLEVRQHIIATRLQIAREKTGFSYNELGKKTGVPVSRIKRYESGSAAIPLDELKLLISVLDLTLDDVMDTDSPVGNWQKRQALINSFMGIPEEMQQFASDPQNRSWVAFVKQLRKAGESNLLALAESIRKLFDQSRE